MSKRIIKLNEQDLHHIVKSAVKQVVRENMEDEGLWNTLKSFGRQYGRKGMNAASQMGQNAAQGVRNAYNNAGQNIRNAYNNAAQGVRNAYNNAGPSVRNAYNNAAQGVRNAYNNARQDFSNTWQNASRDGAMKDMQSAFQDFKNAVAKYQRSGGQVSRQLNSYLSGINNMMNQYQFH